MHWLTLTISAIIGRAVFGLANKILTMLAPLSPAMNSVLFSLVTALLAVMASPFLGGLSLTGVSDVWPILLLLIGVLSLSGIWIFKGQRQLGVGITQIMLSSILIWTVLLSVLFLHSTFSLAQLAGIAVLIIAILIAQYKKGAQAISAAILYILGAAALFAVFQVGSAVVAKHVTAPTYIVIAYVGSALITSLVYAKSLRAELPVLKRQKIATLSKGLLFATGSYMFYLVFSYYAYRVAPDRGVVVILLTSQVVLAVLLGAIFLQEHDNLWRKVFAGLLAIAAGLLIQGL